MIEVIYPTDDDPRKEIKTTIESVNEHLMGNTKDGREISTVERIAEKLDGVFKDSYSFPLCILCPPSF